MSLLLLSLGTNLRKIRTQSHSFLYKILVSEGNSIWLNIQKALRDALSQDFLFVLLISLAYLTTTLWNIVADYIKKNNDKPEDLLENGLNLK